MDANAILLIAIGMLGFGLAVGLLLFPYIFRLK
ncbi:MAG: hypothetical protein H6Q73_3199 [Firmicutes bacterium]|nr:hypothetical protein [Bacillota bacterium]